MRNKLFFGVSFLFLFLISSCTPTDGKRDFVPTYEGMTVTTSHSTRINRNINNHEDKDDQGIEVDITNLVTIDVDVDEEVKYYVMPNETFVIQVHISNPSNYEIQSFTLNGKKYANYMFKDGSTMELLLLETTAPSSSGYLEYSIDAIKYIDGVEIKDVDMSVGDKSIKVGVAYLEGPTASVTSYNVDTTYIEVGVRVDDFNNLIGDNELSIHLSDGNSEISSKPIKVGDNTVRFDSLAMSTTYQYGIIAAFDLADGRETHAEWLLVNTFTTLSAFKIKDVTPSKTAVSFDVERVGELGTISSISLYDANTNELVNEGEPTTRVFESLLSNHTYDLYVDFTYQSNGETISDFVCEKGVKTIAKTTPTVSFQSTTSDKTSISYNVSIEDIDAILNITKVELLKNNEVEKDNGASLNGSFTGLLSNNKYSLRVSYTYDLNDGQGLIPDAVVTDISTEAKLAPTVSISDDEISDTTIKAQLSFDDEDAVGYIDSVKLFKNNEQVASNDTLEISFANLEYFTNYCLVITYCYDLNDGFGLQTKELTKDYKTAPHLEFNSCNIINTSAVSEGETIFMQVSLSNPQGALPSSVVINGEEYDCTSSTTATKIYVEIVNNGQFEGGNTTLTIEKVNMTLDGKSYTIIPSSNNFDSIFINGTLSVLSTKFVNKDLEEITWCFFSEEVYVLITFENKTGYTIDNIGGYTNFTKIDDSNYLIDYEDIYGGYAFTEWNVYLLTTVDYHNEYLNRTLNLNQMIRFYRTRDDSIHYISTADDLMNPNIIGGIYYCELTNSIDLSGIEWWGTYHYGVFNGNGYSINNLSCVTTVKNEKYIANGLFSESRGIIENLEMRNVNIIINAVYDNPSGNEAVYVGALFGNSRNEEAPEEDWLAYETMVKSCYVDGDSLIQFTTSEVSCSEYKFAGGLGGMGGEFYDCRNDASVNSSDVASGIARCHKIVRCINTGRIVGGSGLWFLLGASVDGNNCCTNCINFGDLEFPNYVDYVSMFKNSYILNGKEEIFGFILDEINEDFYKNVLGFSPNIWDFSKLSSTNKIPFLIF